MSTMKSDSAAADVSDGAGIECTSNPTVTRLRRQNNRQQQRPLSAILLGCFVSSDSSPQVGSLYRTKSVECINTMGKEENNDDDQKNSVASSSSGLNTHDKERYKRDRRFSFSKSLYSLFRKTSSIKSEGGGEGSENENAQEEDEEDEEKDAYGFRSAPGSTRRRYYTLEERQRRNRERNLQCGFENPGVSVPPVMSAKQNSSEFSSLDSTLLETDLDRCGLQEVSASNQSVDTVASSVSLACRDEPDTSVVLGEQQVIPAPRLRPAKKSSRSKQRPKSLGDLDRKMAKRWSHGVINSLNIGTSIKGERTTEKRIISRRSCFIVQEHHYSLREFRSEYTEVKSFPIDRSGYDAKHWQDGASHQEGGGGSSDDEGSIYRRGARRWRKLYKVNGHIFQAKRFNRRASCEFCKDRIWGLGRQGFKCTQCKLLVHKKCHKLQKVACNADLDTSTDTLASHDSSTLTRIGTNGKLPMPEFPDPGITEEAPVEMPSKKGLSSEPMSPTGQAGQYCLDDFELIRVIGRGSYAKVLMVELKKTNRIYAMKVIKKTLVTDDEDIDWVQTEKHVFETASNHPFLVGLHSCFQTPSRLFFVIEFVRGGDLMFHMQRQRRLPEEHARFYAAEICLALNFLHEKGIIYRDLKLDNVLLDHEGHIKLTDYGMCKEGIRPGDTTSTFCGTPNYIAPEILQGVEYSFSVDWWALGVLLYEMLAGKSPFDIVGASDNPDCNTEDFLFQVILERPIRIPRSLSVKAASILKGFLNKNPVDRLGCHPETGFTDIVTHPFFKTIDWEMLERKQIPPPYKPRVEGERDLENFDPQFTAEPVQFTPDDQRAIENIDQSEFEGFEYVNPLLMSMEDCV